jgi:CheY-like chemotaxis protein
MRSPWCTTCLQGSVGIYSDCGTVQIRRRFGCDSAWKKDAVGGDNLPGAFSFAVDLRQGPLGALKMCRHCLVEDELPIRTVIADVLSDFGYTVLEAGDGRAGLKILEASTLIDLLVTDVGLPCGMSGRQLANAARKRRPNLRVLFVTGYADNSPIGSGLAAQGMHLMTKPFTLEALQPGYKGSSAGDRPCRATLCLMFLCG